MYMANIIRLDDLLKSDVAENSGILNDVEAYHGQYYDGMEVFIKREDVLSNLRTTLDDLRFLISRIRNHDFEQALDVTSGYRSAELNSAVGGAKYSAHQYGKAVDVSFHSSVYKNDIEDILHQIQLDEKNYIQWYRVYSTYFHVTFR